MPYNGLGAFTPLPPPTYPAVPGELVRSDYFNAIIQDLMTGLSTAATRNGQAAMTGNLPMGGFRVTGAGSAIATADLVTKGQLDAVSTQLEVLAESPINFLTFVTDPVVRASILDGTCTTNLDSAFAAFRAALLTVGTHPVGVFPPGVYPYATATNWAIDNLTIYSQNARFRYTGTTAAFVIDGTAASAVTVVDDFCFAVRWVGRTYIEATATAGAGMFVKSAHHCVFESINIRGCGSGQPGLLVQFAVCSSWPNLVISTNEGGWYSGAMPGTGILLEAFAIGGDPGQTSYCLFENPIIEGMPTGANITGGLGNTLIGGTIEACTGWGVILASATSQTRIINVDLEANTLGDIRIHGFGNEILATDTLTKIQFESGAAENRVIGGRHVTINCLSGSSYNSITDGAYDRLTSGGTLSDTGTYNSFRGMKKPSSPFLGRVLAPVSVTVTASPMTITNTSGDTQYYTLTGGAVGSIFHGRFGTASAGIAYISGQEHTLEPTESLVITYSSAPTITAWK